LRWIKTARAVQYAERSPVPVRKIFVSSLAIAATAFGLILASALFGAFLRRKVPEHHLAGDSKDVIKLATALIGTMAALVLALLFANTRTSFENTSAAVSRMTADILELDQLLDQYGPAAAPVRAALRADVGPWIDAIWQEDAKGHGDKAVPRPHRESVAFLLRALTPQNPAQASIQTRALQVSTDLVETRLALFAQPVDTISVTFIVVLVAWLMFIFGVFSMNSPPNATLCVVLFVCILSASTAIYLTLELAQPFDGLMQLSNAGLRAALH
jgi:hypothetical protein